MVLRPASFSLSYRLRDEIGEEAQRVREMVTKLGVKHHILTLDWKERPAPGKMQRLARQRRYTALLELCKKQKIDFLMTGHHLGDQMGELASLTMDPTNYRVKSRH